MKIKNIIFLFAVYVGSIMSSELPTQTESYRRWRTAQWRKGEAGTGPFNETLQYDFNFGSVSLLDSALHGPFIKFVEECEQRERETNDTHIALYHGRDLMSLSWFDVNKAIYNKYQMAQDKHGNFLNNLVGLGHKPTYSSDKILNSEEFVFLRDSQEVIGTIEDLPAATNDLHQTEKTSKVYYDGQLRALMLSTSLNPIIGLEYASAYSMYKQNISVNNCIDAMQQTLQKHGFAREYAKYLVELYEDYRMRKHPHGCMTQLLIPNEIAAESVYLSKAFGIPYNDEVAQKFKNIGGKALRKDIVDNVAALKRNEYVINKHLYPQARIVLTSKYFADPNSGIQMYHHNPLITHNICTFNKKRDALMTRMQQESKIITWFNVLKKWF